MIKFFVFPILLFLVANSSFAQDSDIDRKVDSLQKVIEQATNDTVLVKAYAEWENLIYVSDPKLDIELNQKIRSICIKNLSNSQGSSSPRFYIENLANTSNVLGIIADLQGNYIDGLKYYQEAYDLFERIDSKDGMAYALTNIGVVYRKQEEYIAALESYRKCLDISVEIEDVIGLSTAYLNIGNIYKDLGKSDSAEIYFQKSYDLNSSRDDLYGMAYAIGNIAEIKLEKGYIAEAKEDYTVCLDYFKRLGSKRDVAGTFHSLGEVEFAAGNYEAAIRYGKQSLDLIEVGQSPFLVEHSANLLYRSYKMSGQYENALELFELYIKTRDTLVNADNQKAIIRQGYKYEYEKQAAADSVKAAESVKIKDAEIAAEHAVNERRQQQSYFLYIGLGLAIVFGGLIFYRFRISQRQKRIIEDQKEKVDLAYEQLGEKNQEILDSISYAKRIQSAIIPPLKRVKERLPESFIIYRPKDIVAGDFYWMEHRDNKTLIAAADCTGHGVPGAMVSVVCNNGLNRAVREHGLFEPGEILNKTREIVIEEFEKSEDDVKDGMDIAICSLEGGMLKYAGAHNPLWIIRAGASKVEETKANKQPIGKFDKLEPYDTHTYELGKGDTVYLFSDGFADQFGGEKGKKFKSSRFKTLLLSIQSEPMEKQKELLNAAFEKWRQNYEQLDDVCVIGFRITT